MGNDRGLFVTPARGSWGQCKAMCASRGARLATPYSQKENRIVQGMTKGKGHLWMGFNDRGSEGKWRGVAGGKRCYTNWAPGEPNNWRNEDCAEIYPNGLWNDLACKNKRFGLCRLKKCA
eukprot:NODE_4763_length_450_cov_2024.900249_g4098_i1.p2 GENE.NODE_4763_length_450_cov_2024.900249_g4098_i1~~NODE_4763_length_450_cov_2024.900249_g4098_i1.p2  ORF type:complete len:137 (-),score=31.69 NODE_4763_length_450_cov_2024.900249_g4098_i1:38-397(-)